MKPEIRADPDVCFGAARLAGSRVTVTAILYRFRAGESCTEMAADYNITVRDIEECLRYRLAGGRTHPLGPTKKRRRTS